MNEHMLGEKFKELRVKKRITLREVSKVIGVSIGDLADIEHGRVVPEYSIQKRLKHLIIKWKIKEVKI